MPSNTDRLAALAARQDTIIFVGSGVSAWSGLPTWRELLEQLGVFLIDAGRSADLVERELANNDLLLAASYGFDQLTRVERCEFLRKTLRIPSAAPSSLHRAISQLGPRCFITTNYDALLERAIREGSPDEFLDVVTPLQQLEIASIVQSRAEGFLFKPHGDLSSCDSIVLTREDYRRLHGSNRNVLEAMRTLLVSRPVIFIGFGLRDPDFLLVQDILSTTFGVNPQDHYALMPDVVSEEADYWLRNYGIRLVSYPTDKSTSGPERHRALLAMLQEIKAQASEARHDVTRNDVSGLILALARHARRLQSTISSTDNRMPLKLTQAQRLAVNDSKHWLRLGPDALDFLKVSRDKLVLEGPPGSGKTFLISQAARDLAQELEQRCLAEDEPEIRDLRVPVILSLRDYHDDIFAMFSQALPFDIQLEDLLDPGIGVFFIDGVNEAPAATETKALINDLTTLIDRAGQCSVIITTRFGAELNELDLPVVLLDEISSEYVRQELSELGLRWQDFNETAFELLQRPLFHSAWKAGYLLPDKVRTVHDVYSQLIEHMERQASDHFGIRVAFGDVFERIAYSMVDSGHLSVGAAEIYANLRASLQDVLDVDKFFSYAISSGTLLATPARRLAFFHHSVAEYFAAQYLAKLIAMDHGSVQRCLGRRDWDQALLLTLGFLSDDEADVVFAEILRTDAAMALRALNYIEGQRAKWIEVALEYLTSHPPSNENAFGLVYALTHLKLSDSNVPALVAIARQQTSFGGAAAGMLWPVASKRRGWILTLLCDGSQGYNYLTALARTIKPQLDAAGALQILKRVEQIPITDESAQALRSGGELDEYTGIISAVAELLKVVPIKDMVSFAQANTSALIEQIICERLQDSRTPSALQFVQQSMLNGNNQAIFNLYLQLEYGEDPEKSELSAPLPGLLQALISAVRNGRMADWALGDIRLFASVLPAVRVQLEKIVREGGLVGALLAYASGEGDRFFELLNMARGADVDWSREPATKALGIVEVSWHGHEELFLNLLRTRQEALAKPLIESLSAPSLDGDEWEISCTISDLEWWIDWLADDRNDWTFPDRLGEFLAKGTDASTRQLIISGFNDGSLERALLADYVLHYLPGLSTDDLIPEAVEWLIGQLSTERYVFWRAPLIGQFTTEILVQERLLPLLLGDPPEPLRTRVLSSLIEAGRRHRRRYVGEDGRVLG